MTIEVIKEPNGITIKEDNNGEIFVGWNELLQLHNEILNSIRFFIEEYT